MIVILKTLIFMSKISHYFQPERSKSARHCHRRSFDLSQKMRIFGTEATFIFSKQR